MIDIPDLTDDQLAELASIEAERSEISERFEQATRQAYARRAEAEIVYTEFLQAFCAGELDDDFEPERIEAICHAAGVTAEQFAEQARELSAIFAERRSNEIFFAARCNAIRQGVPMTTSEPANVAAIEDSATYRMRIRSRAGVEFSGTTFKLEAAPMIANAWELMQEAKERRRDAPRLYGALLRAFVDGTLPDEITPQTVETIIANAGSSLEAFAQHVEEVCRSEGVSAEEAHNRIVVLFGGAPQLKAILAPAIWFGAASPVRIHC